MMHAELGSAKKGEDGEDRVADQADGRHRNNAKQIACRALADQIAAFTIEANDRSLPEPALQHVHRDGDTDEGKYKDHPIDEDILIFLSRRHNPSIHGFGQYLHEEKLCTIVEEMKRQGTSAESFFFGYPRHAFGRGDVIIRAGEVPDGVYYLTSGLVRQEAISPRGETFIITVFRPGAYFPMLWAITNTSNGYQYEAATATTAYRATKSEVLRFLSRHPEELWRFTKRLVTGINGLLGRFEYLMFDTAYRKTVLLLLYFARRFGKQEDGVTLISVPLAHREIAAWIGATRETASVQMEALKKKGLIKTRGRQLIIPSIAALEKEGESEW